MNKLKFKKAVNEVVRLNASKAKKVYIEIEKNDGEFTAWVSTVNGYGSFTNMMIAYLKEYDEIDVTYYDLHSGIHYEPVRQQINYRICELLNEEYQGI